MVLIIFGVSGAGKTTVGRLLAQELGWKFYEGDDFHSQANIEKMRSGVPLTDEDRRPWLDKSRDLIQTCLAIDEDAVLACSALKEKYRRQLRVSTGVKLVYLRGDRVLITDRQQKRKGHFMNPELLESQFADLEEPQADEEAIVVDLRGTPQEIVGKIKEQLKLKTQAGSSPSIAFQETDEARTFAERIPSRLNLQERHGHSARTR